MAQAACYLEIHTLMEKVTRDDVAVFVDFENVYVSVREKFDATPNFELIMDRCEDYGRIVIARAYADWYRYPRVTSALFANGVEPMYVPTYYYDRDVGRTGRPIKNSVDIHLCIDAMRTLYSQPNILKFVLVTGDRDFIPLVNAIRQHGKDVIVIGIGGAASAHLAQSADEFLFYEQIADLATPQPARQIEEVRKPEERRERGDRQERSRADRAPRAETRPEPVPQEVAPVQEVAPTADRNPYDTLVDAVKLARQRGFVVNLGSLKVVMRELDSTFHESKAKDSSGRGFSKFKDFVKEAERQGKVQIFTNGTVTEIFLPEEDPYTLSQFAEDLASQRAERELETELEQEAQLAETVPVPDVQLPAPEAAIEPIQAEAAPESGDEAVTAEPDAAGTTRPFFGDREWDIFRGSMSQFSEPVRFAEIFNALRGLRNQEVMELTNNELKELVKQAINRGMLQRTGRGARAYYRLSSQYRLPRTEAPDTTPVEPVAPPAQDMADLAATAAAVAEQAAAVEVEVRRRARQYERIVPAAPAAEAGAAEAQAPAIVDEVEAAPAGDEAALETPPELQAATPLETEIVEASAETPAPPTRRRRRKSSAGAGNGQNGATADNNGRSEAEAKPEAAESSTKRRRKKTAPAEVAAPEQPPAAEARENGTKTRRRRKKAASNGDGDTSGQG